MTHESTLPSDEYQAHSPGPSNICRISSSVSDFQCDEDGRSNALHSGIQLPRKFLSLHRRRPIQTHRLPARIALRIAQRARVRAIRKQRLHDIDLVCQALVRERERQRGLRPDLVVRARVAAREDPPHLVHVVAGDREEKGGAGRGDCVARRGEHRSRTGDGRRERGCLGRRRKAVCVILVIGGEPEQRGGERAEQARTSDIGPMVRMPLMVGIVP